MPNADHSSLDQRPRSPHLGIYRFQITMVLSVLHRGTGIFLAIGTPLLVYWLYTLQAGELVYRQAQVLFTHWIVLFALAGWTFSMFYHLCNGIRHLFWDIGKGYEIATFYRSGYAVVIVSGLLTGSTLYAAWIAGNLP